MTPRGRRAAIAILIALGIALALAPAALAAAGGGSSGFSGGGGGGGGGGGRGAGLYILIQILIRIAIFGHGLGLLIIIGVVLAYFLITRLGARAQGFASARSQQGRAARRRSAQRERRVELAAAEASEEDPAFDPDVVRPAAAKLFLDIQAAWDGRDRRRLHELVGPDLMQEWERRLDDFDRRGWHNRVQPIGEPTVMYVGLQNRGEDERDRVVVRIEAKLRDYVEDGAGRTIKRTGRVTETTRVREYWTLGKSAGGQSWVLISIEQGGEGSHALDGQLVATPWSDEQGLRDEAMVEQAVADALPDHVSPAEVADLQYDGDARAAALDLSVADGRFAPDVLEIAARRAVDAWAEAVDGDDHALRTIAAPEAVTELLHPGDPSRTTRLVVRGPVVRQIRIAHLDAAAQPPAMTIDVELSGRRYIEQRDTAAVLSGSQSRETSFTERWTLTLSGDAAQPWRIARVATALARS